MKTINFDNNNYLKKLFIVTSDNKNYNWSSCYAYADVRVVSDDFILIDFSIGLLRLKKIILISTKICISDGIILISFLNKFKRFFIQELSEPTLKNFYICFLDKIYGFFTRFKYFICIYKDFKYFSNYSNTQTGSLRLPSLVFMTKRSTKIYKKFFFSFLKLRILTIKSNSIVDSIDNICFNIFINDCIFIYYFLRNIYIFNNTFSITKW